MNSQIAVQRKFQHFMLANGMIYSVVQIGMLMFAGIFILPLLGSPAAPLSERYEAYATHATILRVGNYMWALPPIFFVIFLGGIYAHFNKIHESIKGILFTVLLSGAVLIMIWPMGAIISLLGIDIAMNGGDVATGGSFDTIVPYSLGLSTIPRAVFLVCFSFLLIENRALAIMGFVTAALSLCGTLILVSGFFVTFSLFSAVLFHVWIFFVSRKMYVEAKISKEALVIY